jgi:hypothetical protein
MQGVFCEEEMELLIIKIKFTLEQVMKVQRRRRCTTLLFL